MSESQPIDLAKAAEHLEIVNALNRHGAFFHRLITASLLNYRDNPAAGPIRIVEVISEYPTFVSKASIADLVIRAVVSFPEGTPQEPFNLTFVIECKKGFSEENRIVLINPVEKPEYIRLMRRSVTSPKHGTIKHEGPSHHISPLPLGKSSEIPVCDDGFWLMNKKRQGIVELTAEKNPLYDAANQVSNSLIGLMGEDKDISVRKLKGGGDSIGNHYLPIIITNLSIFVADSDPYETDINSGESKNVSLTEVDAAFFIHPFARQSIDPADIRNDGHFFEGLDPHRDKETILIMKPSALRRLFEWEDDSNLAQEIYDTFYGYSFGK